MKYEWIKDEDGHYHIERKLTEDTSKKPEIPQATGVVQRLKEATNKAHARTKNILDKLTRMRRETRRDLKKGKHQ